ncbi:MAG TPA: glycosyltransferase family 39 protein [Acidimicrobiales bacterium]
MALTTQGGAEEQLVVLSYREPATTGRRLGGEQAGVALGQMAAGAGNLVFALAAARILDPAGFARLSVFLGLYLVLSLPATSLSAATAVDPRKRDALLRKVSAVSLLLAVVMAAASPGLAALLNVPIPMVVGLAAVLPASAPLALDRGRLYGTRRHRRLVESLVAEPAVRLSVGLSLAAWTGPVGAAAGVVIAAYTAREVARGRRHARRRLYQSRASAGREGTAGWTAAAFALLALLQTQDLVFANAILPGGKAAAYAALSTLGGAAAFATVTIPLVLLPRAVRRDKHSLAVAAGLAGVLGMSAVSVTAIAPHALSVALFGSRYGSITPYLVPYMMAMGLLGIGRVLVAHRCATGAGPRTTLVAGVVVVGQWVAIAIWGRSVGTVAATTVAATAALLVGIGVESLVVLRAPAVGSHFIRSGQRIEAAVSSTAHGLPRRAISSLGRAAHDPVVLAMSAVTLAGLAVRFVVPRGIWLDEATSIHQASMPFGEMLKNLGSTDVHPPLYFAVLWTTDHLIGSGPLAMRLPSVLAGTLAVPAAYLAARDLWDRRSGVIAGVLASVAPILVWYSQEVRMYSLFMLFALLALWGQARVLRYGTAGGWVIYVLSSAALVWTEYFAVFQLVTQQAVFVAAIIRRPQQRRQLLVALLIATFLMAVLIAPLEPFAWHQFVVNQTAGKGFGAPSQVGLAGAQSISVYTVLANLAWAVVGYHSAAVMAAIVALWPIGIFLALFLLGRNMTDRTAAVLATAVVPVVLLLAIGLVKRNLFEVRYLSGVVVALLLLCSRLVTGASRSIRMQATACVAIVALLAGSLGDEQVNGSNPRLYDFAGALHAVQVRYRPGDLLVYSPGDLDLVVSYYAPHIDAVQLGQAEVGRPAGTELFVLGSSNLMAPNEPSQLGRYLSDLRHQDRLVAVVKKANATVWVFKV